LHELNTRPPPLKTAAERSGSDVAPALWVVGSRSVISPPVFRAPRVGGVPLTATNHKRSLGRGKAWTYPASDGGVRCAARVKQQGNS